MKIDAAVCSNMGRVRQNNEDNFYFNGLYMNESQRNDGGMFSRVCGDDVQIYAVCDGMGGEEGGEDASIAMVRGIQDYAKSTTHVDSSDRLKKMLQSMSNAIEASAQKKGIRSGTTIAMLVIEDNQVRAVHVGDSRVYRLKDRHLSRMTVDHSEVQRLFSMGLITREEMDTHPKRHAISQFLGMPHEEVLLSPGIGKREPLTPGTRYLICSDGLTDMVKDPELQEIMARSTSAEEAVKRCITSALRHGGRDNVTAVVLFVESGKSGMKQTTKNKLMLALTGLGLLAGIAMAAFSLLRILA